MLKESTALQEKKAESLKMVSCHYRLQPVICRTAITSAQKSSAQDPSKTDTSNFPVGMIKKKKKAREHGQKGSIYSWHSEIF